MSHGGDSANCDPNLTPLLDIVLQLLMFFILITRFESVAQNPEPVDDDNQFDNRIVLPTADSANPLDRGATDFVYLLVNRNGTFFFPLDHDAPERTFEEVVGDKGWLYEMKRERAVKQNVEFDKVSMPTVIIKAHGDLPFERFDKILEKCKDLKMYDVRLRVEKALRPAA
jgi:biopolymer transport protein ExbD